jgi:hypothetical protein
MYGSGGGAGDLVAVVPTTAGIIVLPNTGGNHLLFVISLLSTIIGTLILTSTVVRLIAKKIYKA